MNTVKLNLCILLQGRSQCLCGSTVPSRLTCMTLVYPPELVEQESTVSPPCKKYKVTATLSNKTKVISKSKSK